MQDVDANKGLYKIQWAHSNHFPTLNGGVGTHYHTVYVLTMVVTTNPET